VERLSLLRRRVANMRRWRAPDGGSIAATVNEHGRLMMMVVVVMMMMN